ncbi:hypothetical protein B0H16DRAFT_1811001 [Mycena metata]|uniref:BHLH domain-containing protein n=1 Tax=Mycena metata TaxID=1033252 RepID=A0AAD7ME89_9AGAR|nr:hypothetical protein B0H16DRAFT_1811001 [Mycena metata]
MGPCLSSLTHLSASSLPALPLLVNRGITTRISGPREAENFSQRHSNVPFTLRAMKGDIAPCLHPSDPLNLLLHNYSQHNMHQTDDDLSPSIGAPPAWNSLSSLWPPEDKMDDIPSSQAWTSAWAWASTPPTFQSLLIHIRGPVPVALVRVRERRQHRLVLPSVDTGYSTSSNNPAAELANCVRKNAGIILAVQIASEPQYHLPAFTAPPAPSYPAPNIAASAFATAPVAPSAPPMPATPSLRQAVPALRVVDRAAAIKAGESFNGGDASDPEDHIDARGFVDGVKIARKRSKANVLGQAVEYIHVLKNRERRLTRELEELKTLLRGLVGGTELLGEWEREWGERDEAGVQDGDEEGESNDEGGGGEGKKRKKAKVAVEAAPKVEVERKPAAAPVVEGEKMKRGRPRKVVPPLRPTACTSVRDVRIISIRQRGIGAKGKEASLPPSCSPPSFPMLSFPSDPLLSRHRRAPAPSSRALHRGCICCMCALHAALVPIPLVFVFALPSPPSCTTPHCRLHLALGSDAAHAHAHAVSYVESPGSSPSPFSPPFPPFPAIPARTVESSADCTKLDSAVQLRVYMPSLNKYDIFQIPV